MEAIELDGLGVVVLEYLPEFRTLDELDTESEADLAPALFSALRTMHEHDLLHGDLRAENVLIRDGEIYFIDATSVADAKAADAKSAPGVVTGLVSCSRVQEEPYI